MDPGWNLSIEKSAEPHPACAFRATWQRSPGDSRGSVDRGCSCRVARRPLLWILLATIKILGAEPILTFNHRELYVMDGVENFHGVVARSLVSRQLRNFGGLNSSGPMMATALCSEATTRLPLNFGGKRMLDALPFGSRRKSPFLSQGHTRRVRRDGHSPARWPSCS